MQSWISSISSVVMPITAVLAVVLAGIKLWMEIRANATMSSDMATLKSSFVVRNWASLLALVCGMAAMFSVALVPLAPSSVLVALIGAACTACGFAGVLVLEISWRLTDRVAAVLAERKGASAVSP